MRIVRARDLDQRFYSPAEWDASERARVCEILKAVKERGDEAVLHCTEIFDRIRLGSLKVDPAEIKQASLKMSASLKSAIKMSVENIRAFAEAQFSQYRDFEIQTKPGLFCGQRLVPMDRVGIYVPGGKFPLFSSLLMSAIPAQVAGVKEIAVSSPPSCQGTVHPIILAVIDMLGVKEIYNVGGVQAIGAMAFGTESIKKVDKICGPGNRFVSMAKKEVSGIVGIDLQAGPTEIIIVADRSARPELIAADLIAQAEHDEDAVAVLVTDSREIAEAVSKEIEKEIGQMATGPSVEVSIKKNGLIILVDRLSDALDICNRKAPEHLELHLRDTHLFRGKLRSYGTLFCGEYSAEVLGDYASGLNHILPTGGSARFSSGLSVRDFIKIQTTLRAEPAGVVAIGPAVQIMAQAEGLIGHSSAVEKRLKIIDNC